jgi:hypothetical protein
MCVQFAVHTILRTGDRMMRRKGDAKGQWARNGVPLASDGAAVLAGTSHQPPFIESDDCLAGCNYQTEEHCRDVFDLRPAEKARSAP